MKTKILISHSYFYKFDKKQWEFGEPYPPLMTIGAAAFLRKHGFEVDLYDVGLRSSIGDLPEKILKFRPDYFVILDDGFNYLTKMCLTNMRMAAFEMQKIAKKSGATVITCSSDSTDHYQEYLEHSADFVLLGEGEYTLLELIQNLNNKKDPYQIPGISFFDGTHFRTTQKRPVISDLDQIPLPAWDLVDIDAYLDIWKSHNRTPYINVATTRGCPFKCNWCAKPIYGMRYNTRSVSKVLEEIELHINKHKINHFWMCDDIFGLKPGWVQEFNSETQKRNLQFKYKIQSRADLLLKEDNIAQLAQSGLDEVWIGAESGSQHILDAMDKGTTIEQIEKATFLLQSHGIKVAYFIQFGYLGETIADIKKTIKMVLRMMPDKIGVSVSYPLPGTKFYDIVKEDLKQKANWTDSDDLDMMFQNVYPRKFYKVLQRFIHNCFKIKKGWVSLLNIHKNLKFKDIKRIVIGVISLVPATFNIAQLTYARYSKQ